jgi:hypothetical protein
MLGHWSIPQHLSITAITRLVANLHALSMRSNPSQIIDGQNEMINDMAREGNAGRVIMAQSDNSSPEITLRGSSSARSENSEAIRSLPSTWHQPSSQQPSASQFTNPSIPFYHSYRYPQQPLNNGSSVQINDDLVQQFISRSLMKQTETVPALLPTTDNTVRVLNPANSSSSFNPAHDHAGRSPWQAHGPATNPSLNDLRLLST